MRQSFRLFQGNLPDRPADFLSGRFEQVHGQQDVFSAFQAEGEGAVIEPDGAVFRHEPPFVEGNGGRGVYQAGVV